MENMKTVNVKTQKWFPPQVQLYFSWQGLVSVKAIVLDEAQNIQDG